MEVSSQERALIVVSYLATRKPFFFYRATEWAGIWCAKWLLKEHYRHFEVLRGSEASYAAFQQAVNRQASDNAIKAVDVIVNLHGGKRSLVFAPHESISYGAIAFWPNASAKLRLIYSTACNAASGNGDWLRAGFRVAIGAEALNINALTEYPALLRAWANGDKVANMMRKAAGPLGKLTDRLGEIFSKDVNSMKAVAGDTTVTISRMPG